MTTMLAAFFGWLGRLLQEPSPKAHYFAEAHGHIACVWCEREYSRSLVGERCPWFAERSEQA